MGSGYTARHAACLAVCLPPEGAVARAEGDGWSESERLLALIERWGSVADWRNTRDGQKGRNAPKLVDSPRRRRRDAEDREKYTKSYMDDVAEALGIPEDRR